MKVHAIYGKFNALIESASIETETESSFEFIVSEIDNEKYLEVKSVNNLTQEEISLRMNAEEVKQFNLLVSQFMKQLL